MTVIFRKDVKANEIVAFLPEHAANYGNIMSYAHIGQHCEASLEYYQNTKKASMEEYLSLLRELQMIYGEELQVRQRLHYDTLVNSWRRISYD